MTKKKAEVEKKEGQFEDFPFEAKKELVEIINDCPSLEVLDGREYRVKRMRYYSIYRICNLVMDMRKADDTMDDDNAIMTALCTDLDAMCEIVAIVLCNHMFTPDDIRDYDSALDVMSRNDKLVEAMKAKVMCSTYEPNQWASIIIGAIKSIDLSAFFLLKKSVSMGTDSLLTRKKKSEETASQFMEALSLQTRPTS